MLLNDEDEPPLKKYFLFCTIAYVAVMVFVIVQYVIINNIVASNTDATQALHDYRKQLLKIYNITKNNTDEPPYCPNFYSNTTICKSEFADHPNQPN